MTGTVRELAHYKSEQLNNRQEQQAAVLQVGLHYDGTSRLSVMFQWVILLRMVEQVCCVPGLSWHRSLEGCCDSSMTLTLKIR